MRYVLVATLVLVAVIPGVGAAVSAAPPSLPSLLYIGLSVQTPPADSLTFRQALASAIDRERVARAASPHASGPVQPALTIQHPALPGFQGTTLARPYDPTRAQELLAQSGWMGPITILVGPGSGEFPKAVQQAVVDSIAGVLKLPVRIQQVANFAVLVRNAHSGLAAIYMYGWRSDTRDFGYPSFALGIAHDLSDPEARALAESRDPTATERLLLEKVLIIPLLFYQSRP